MSKTEQSLESDFVKVFGPGCRYYRLDRQAFTKENFKVWFKTGGSFAYK